MSQKIFHVGLMKSGTTYVQEILSQNKPVLREQGWEYPGMRLNQQHACYSLCGSDIPWLKAPMPSKLGEDLAERIRASKNNLIISAEALSVLSDVGIERFLSKVGVPDKIIFTIRGLGKTLPSAWQQYLKGGGRTTFMKFIQKLEMQREDLSGFWRTYAYGHSVARWAKYAPVEVVVLPSIRQSDETLWELFREATGLPDVPVKSVPPEKANVSLSVESANILRHINKLLPKHSKESDRLRNLFLTRAVFPLAATNGGMKIGLPENAAPIVDAWNKEECALLFANASKVHGIEADLMAEGNRMKGNAGREANRFAKVAANQIVALLNQE